MLAWPAISRPSSASCTPCVLYAVSYPALFSIRATICVLDISTTDCMTEADSTASAYGMDTSLRNTSWSVSKVAVHAGEGGTPSKLLSDNDDAYDVKEDEEEDDVDAQESRDSVLLRMRTSECTFVVSLLQSTDIFFEGSNDDMGTLLTYALEFCCISAASSHEVMLPMRMRAMMEGVKTREEVSGISARWYRGTKDTP